MDTPQPAAGVTPTPQNTIESTNYKTPLTKLDFNKKYWFNSLQLVTVVNPKPEDYLFMVEMRHFVVRAGTKEKLPGVIANVYLDQMSKILAQDEDRLSYMTDPNLMRVYYDRLIASVESLVQETNPVPEYLRNVPSSARLETPDDRPPWESGMERATDVAPNSPPPPPPPAPTPPPAAPPKPEAGTKEFELNGLTFSAVTDAEGASTYFKNGKEISEADYAKAASMI